MNWFPDTCFCAIETEAPSKEGTFLKRCRIHATSRKTTEVYTHNLTHRARGSESIDQSRTRKDNVKESTR